MSNVKGGLLLLAVACIVATGFMLYTLGGINPTQMQVWLRTMGIWAPIIYLILYVVATVLVLPSTALNLTGGALFGVWLGTFWTSLGAILAAVVAFVFSRTVGQDAVAHRLGDRWKAMDAEVTRGGAFYMFAIRLVPIMPYGLVNFAAGLTSVSFKDFLIGTALGTVPSVFPFVLLGDSGVKALHTGNVLPVVGALSLIGITVATSTFIKHRQHSRKRIQRR